MANYEEKTLLMDEATSKRAVSRIAYEIVERNRGTENLVIIGIQTKGVSLAKLIIKKIEEIEGIKLELGSLDITFYRDDLTRLSKHPVVAGNDIAFSIEDKKIILVDDVLYSGRTIRAAMEELFDMGRPEKIELAVLVDRGNRELPIRADYIGKDVPTSHGGEPGQEVIGGQGDVRRFVDEQVNRHRQPAFVFPVGYKIQRLDELPVNHADEVVEGLVRIGDTAEQGHLSLSHFLQMEIIGVSKTGDLGQIKSRQYDTHADQNTLEGFASSHLKNTVLLYGDALRVPHF